MRLLTGDACVQAIATAMARAVAEISSSCVIKGETTACVVSEANVKATAEVRAPPPLVTPLKSADPETNYNLLICCRSDLI